MTLHIVGAEGYIGSALRGGLINTDYKTWDILCGEDIRDIDPTYFNGDTVVFLAGLNREHEDWNIVQYDTIMRGITRAAGEIMGQAKRLIFLSSMRAWSGDQSRYAYHKRCAEEQLNGENVTIIRPGTVFGPGIDSWDEAMYARVRADTAVNFALVNRLFKGDHWSAWCSEMDEVLKAIKEEIVLEDCPGRRVRSPVLYRPVTAQDLRDCLSDCAPKDLITLAWYFNEEDFRLSAEPTDRMEALYKDLGLTK